MKWNEMKPLVAYKVTKSSTDMTFQKNELIWLSKNGMMNGCGGFLMEEEWNNEGTNDFEVEENEDYCVLEWNGSEGLRKKAEMPYYEYKERWDELKQRLEKAEYELLGLINGNASDDFERNRLNSKVSGLRIALEYMREMEL